MLARSLTLAALMISLTTPAHATPEQGTLCPSADANGDDARYCVYDVPRAPDSPTFFIRKNGTKVTISRDRAARKLTRWGYVLEQGFWVKAENDN